MGNFKESLKNEAIEILLGKSYTNFTEGKLIHVIKKFACCVIRLKYDVI